MHQPCFVVCAHSHRFRSSPKVVAMAKTAVADDPAPAEVVGGEAVVAGTKRH
jgi:hypothetical protein